MTWRFPNGLRIGNLFSAGTSWADPVLTVYSLPWHASVPSGAMFNQPSGFYATTPFEAPTEVTFNGYSGCAVTLS